MTPAQITDIKTHAGDGFGPNTVISLCEAVESLRRNIRAIELAIDGLNTKGHPQKADTQKALDTIKAHCRAALSQ